MISETLRACFRCKQSKPHDEFGAHTYCKACYNAWQRERTARLSAEERRARRRRSYESEDAELRNRRARHRRWGLSDVELADLLARQGGRCALCLRTEPSGRGTWHVDHDHTCCSGPRSCGSCIRGLLCTRCNVGLGNFQDDPARLRAAANYLERHRQQI